MLLQIYISIFFFLVSIINGAITLFDGSFLSAGTHDGHRIQATLMKVCILCPYLCFLCRISVKYLLQNKGEEKQFRVKKYRPNQSQIVCFFFFFPDADAGWKWTEAQCAAERDRWREGRKRWFVEEESRERTFGPVTWHGHTRVWKAL